MLTCHNLTLKNSIFTVFNNVCFTVLAGGVLVLQGPNGSGKTSLLKMIPGLIKNNIGRITWNNIDINKDILSFNKNISYIGHKNALKPELSVIENLEFWAKFKGEIELLPAAIHYFQLEDILDTKLRFLSSGWQRRVELSKLLLSNTHLWLLDEPETNLDSSTKNILRGLIEAKARDGGIVLIASHNLIGIRNAACVNLLDFKNETLDFIA